MNEEELYEICYDAIGAPDMKMITFGADVCVERPSALVDYGGIDEDEERRRAKYEEISFDLL